MDIIGFMDRYLDPTLKLAALLLVVSFFFTLYAIALVNRRLRLVHEELKQLTEDNKLLNESIQFLQTQMGHQDVTNQPPQTQPQIRKV
jgi:hypothetical protein